MSIIDHVIDVMNDVDPTLVNDVLPQYIIDTARNMNQEEQMDYLCDMLGCNHPGYDPQAYIAHIRQVVVPAYLN